jgi:hypothetical protein
MDTANLYLNIRQQLQDLDEFLGLGVFDEIAHIAIPAVSRSLEALSTYSNEDFERIVLKEYLRAHNEIAYLGDKQDQL